MRLTRQSGVSLAEVLVAVVVLALAVIGAAGLQWRAIRAAQEAGLQSAASQIAADLAEDVRAFSGTEPARETINPFAGFSFDSASEPEPSARSCHASACTPAELAASERREIAQRVRDALPEGRILVCADDAPWNEEAQALDWTCPDAGGRGPLVVKIGWRSRQDGQPVLGPVLAHFVLQQP